MQVNVGVRPEDLVQVDPGQALFTGQVGMTEALGEVTLLYFGGAGDDAAVTAKLPGIHKGLRGQEVSLTADAAKVHLFHNGRSLRYR